MILKVFLDSEKFKKKNLGQELRYRNYGKITFKAKRGEDGERQVSVRLLESQRLEQLRLYLNLSR